MGKKKQMTYDEALNELQQIVNELQEEVIDMEELSRKAKRAADLVKYCQEKLRKVEEEVKGLFTEE